MDEALKAELASIKNALVATTEAVEGQTLTAGTATAVSGAQALIGSVVSKFSWTKAMVNALGSNLTGDITVCTLPAKTLVKRAIIRITTQGAGTTTMTVSLGRTGTGYIDWIKASDAKAADGTMYGLATADIGTGMDDLLGDLPSMTAGTAVKLHFVTTVEHLDDVSASAGDVFLETIVLP